MSQSTLDDFKDHYIDPNLHPFEMLCHAAEVVAKEYEQEHANSVSCTPKNSVSCNPKKPLVGMQEHTNSISCIPKKPRSALKTKLQLGPKKIVEKDAGEEISRKQGFHKETAPRKKPNIDCEIEEAVRKDVAVKNGRQPTISETETYLNDDKRFQRLRKNTNLNCTYKTLVDDEAWVPEDSRKKKKTSSESSGSTKKHKIIRSKQHLQIGQEPAQDLPDEFKNKISEMGGTDVTLLIQKALFPTDLTTHHNRLLMPLTQVKKSDFLREGESRVLEKRQAIEVPLIQPSLELINMILCRWDMRKKSGAVSPSYVLRSSWKNVVTDNQLKKHDIVQVWSFRVQEKLCMALAKVNNKLSAL